MKMFFKMLPLITGLLVVCSNSAVAGPNFQLESPDGMTLYPGTTRMPESRKKSLQVAPVPGTGECPVKIYRTFVLMPYYLSAAFTEQSSKVCEYTQTNEYRLQHNQLHQMLNGPWPMQDLGLQIEPWMFSMGSGKTNWTIWSFDQAVANPGVTFLASDITKEWWSSDTNHYLIKSLSFNDPNFVFSLHQRGYKYGAGGRRGAGEAQYNSSSYRLNNTPLDEFISVSDAAPYANIADLAAYQNWSDYLTNAFPRVQVQSTFRIVVDGKVWTSVKSITALGNVDFQPFRVGIVKTANPLEVLVGIQDRPENTHVLFDVDEITGVWTPSATLQGGGEVIRPVVAHHFWKSMLQAAAPPAPVITFAP